MNTTDISATQNKGPASMIDDEIRHRTLRFAKNFKTSWLELGQSLYAIHQDKFYHGWGFEKFETYTEEELGLQKSVCLKLLKTYLFLETDEPAYLQQEFKENRDTVHVPHYDELNVLRMAKEKKELLKEDYQKLKKDVYDKGKGAAEIRKELTALMKERKEVDPDEERDRRNEIAIRRMITSIRSFQKDMETLKLVPEEIVKDAKDLLNKLEFQVPDKK